MTRNRRGTAYGMDSPKAAQWADRAACKPRHATWFDLVTATNTRHIRLTEDNRAALALCQSCPVRRECLEHELAREDPWPRIAGGQLLGVGDKTRTRLAECGTDAGYQRHKSRREKACLACALAHSNYVVERRWAAKHG